MTKAVYCNKKLSLALEKKGIEASSVRQFEKGGSWYNKYTLDVAMKWLRDVYRWNIYAEQKCFDGGNRLHPKYYLRWCPYIQDVKLPPEQWDFGQPSRRDITSDDFYHKGYKMAFDSFEEACAEAIRYCIDNLINE